jgi:hypothetical protein
LSARFARALPRIGRRDDPDRAHFTASRFTSPHMRHEVVEERRVERVRAALVNMGAPADKVVEGPPAPAEAIMGRRAEITADLY